MDEFYFKEMRTWGHSKISSDCAYKSCESRELGGKRSSRFPCVTPVVETFSSVRVTFRTLSNINTPQPKQPTVLTCRLLLQKSPTTGFRPDSKYASHQRYCQYRVWVDCKCIAFVAAGWCTITRKCTSLNYEKSYFWWYGYSACGDSTRSKWIEKH